MIATLTAWLRGRRKEVPTEEEVLKSLGISLMKKENARKVAVENPFVVDDSKDGSTTANNTSAKVEYPVFNEYEHPGARNKKS